MALSPSEREEILIRLIETHETDLLRLCCVILSDEHLAQDALQETFFKAYRTLDHFRKESSEKTWLTRIAINTCRDIKRQRWFRFVDSGLSTDHLPEPSDECTQAQHELTLDIMNLPSKYQSVILLHYYQEMTLEQIAKTLRISRRTVSYRLEKARRMLKIELQKEDAHE